VSYAWGGSEGKGESGVSKVAESHKAFRGNFVIADDQGKKYFVLKSVGMPKVGSELPSARCYPISDEEYVRAQA
jgi:hypothetical protein